MQYFSEKTAISAASSTSLVDTTKKREYCRPPICQIPLKGTVTVAYFPAPALGNDYCSGH